MIDHKTTCYYAHFMGTYNTPVEARDVKLLESLGFSVTNPNCDTVQNQFLNYKELNEDNYMDFFTRLASRYDVVAFRALPDGSIPGGVAMEVEAARNAGKIIIELPCGITRRSMNHAETVEYLENIGQR